MSLTPADVHNIAFKKPSIGKRGYDQDQVDAFLDSLEQDLTVLIEENNDLRALVARGGGAPDRSAADARLSTARDELTAQLDRVRRETATAEHTASTMRAQLAQAQPRGGPVVADEREHSSRVLAMAEHTAGNHLDDARRAARQLLSDARATAQQITAEALANADALGRDSRRRHQEAITGADARRAAAQQQIDDLDALQREYRSQLRTHVANELRDLHAPGTAPA